MHGVAHGIRTPMFALLPGIGYNAFDLRPFHRRIAIP